MEKFSVHRALSLIKTTRKRIEEKIRDSIFITIRKAKSGVVEGMSIDEVQKKIQGNYDSIVRLIQNYEQLQLGVLRSNAGITSETTGLNLIKLKDGRETSTVGVITLQKALVYQEIFLEKLKNEWTRTQNNLQRQNAQVEERLDKLLLAQGGGDKSKLSSEEIEQQSKVFHQNNDWQLVDPLELEKKISELEKKISDLQVEFDSILSEQNALNVIEVDLYNE